MDIKEWQQDPIKAFSVGVECGIARWEAMTLAIENGWGGHNGDSKRTNMIKSIIDNFKHKRGKVDSDEMEEYLSDTLSKEFNTEAEDGSVQWLSKLFATLWVDCVDKKDFTGLRKLAGTQVQKVTAQAMTDSDDDEGDDEGDSGEDGDEVFVEDTTSLPQRMGDMQIKEEDEQVGQSSANDADEETEEKQGPIIDEDGFETVSRKNNRGKKKK